MIEGIEKAIDTVLSDLDSVTLHFLESCVSCGICAPFCPYTIAGPIYEPADKAEEMRYIYRKKMTIAGKVLGPLVGAKYPKDEKDLDRMINMAYRCVNCRYCYQTCAFGIYSGKLVIMLRRILDKVGRTPSTLKYLQSIELSDSVLINDKVREKWDGILKEAKEAIGKDLPLDKQGAEIVYLPWLVEALLTPEVIVSTIKILDMVGENWTMPSEPLGFEPPMGVIVGDRESERKVFRRINSYIAKVGGKKALISHGGTPYMEMRFEMPFVMNEKPSYDVIHVTEYLSDLYEKGKIRIRREENGKVTWHDPCKLARGSGVVEQPRILIKASTSNYEDLPRGTGMYSHCCGGGTGIALITCDGRKLVEEFTGEKIKPAEWEERFCPPLEEDYKKAIKQKVDEISEINANIVVTGCSTCIYNINKGATLYDRDFQAVHIVQYLLDKIEVT